MICISSTAPPPPNLIPQAMTRGISSLTIPAYLNNPWLLDAKVGDHIVTCEYCNSQITLVKVKHSSVIFCCDPPSPSSESVILMLFKLAFFRHDSVCTPLVMPNPEKLFSYNLTHSPKSCITRGFDCRPSGVLQAVPAW